MLKKLIKVLHEGDYSCVIGKNGELRTFTQRGVRDLYDLLQNEPNFLHGASVADKVVGKAAAALMTLGGVKQFYADLVSEPALDLLRNAGIAVEFGKQVPHIENRDRTGWCPLETACSEENEPEKILPIIERFIQKIIQ